METPKASTEQVIAAAIDEITIPTFELTKQYLHTNKLRYVDGKPTVEDVIFHEDGSGAAVYFPILDEDYYFVVYIDIGSSISIDFMNMSAGNSVKLVVMSDESPLSQLLEHLDVIPSKQWEKGSRVSAKSQFMRPTSGFYYRHTAGRTGEVEDKLKALLDFLKPRKEALTRLSRIASIGISIAYHGYKEEMWGVHFDQDVIAAVAELGLDIDLDLYAGGPDLAHPCWARRA